MVSGHHTTSTIPGWVTLRDLIDRCSTDDASIAGHLLASGGAERVVDVFDAADG